MTAITGGLGFLGWHLACRLRATAGVVPARLDRHDLADESRLRAGLGGSDVIYHVAGVNRADSSEEVEAGNIDIARSLAEAVRHNGRPVRLVYANSVQADDDNHYGRGKRRAAQELAAAVAEVGGGFVDVLLPNLFGEHGRPNYNSFVATFADRIARGEEPMVTEDREIPLLHAQRAAQALIDAATSEAVQIRPVGEMHAVTDVLARLQGFHGLYAARGEVPDLSHPFDVDLFNTYRSYLFPTVFPMFAEPHDDARGRLVETVRSHGGTGQSFVSTTAPGHTRGDHYHLHKIERFFVVRGEAEIAVRRLYDSEVVRFRLSGETPAFVDMPTMWVHNITNVGSTELVTVFWADQLLDPTRPDQYAERVELDT